MSIHLFIRLLNKCGQLIDVQQRSLETSSFATSEPTLTFTSIDNPLAIIKTIGSIESNGSKLFSSISIDENATHIFCVLYTATLSAVERDNYFIVFNGKNYRILAVTNINERDSVLAFQATERGDSTLEASEA